MNMGEPNSLAAVLGIKYSSAIAGFAGGVVRLSIRPPLRWYQAILTVVVGAVTSAYTTPLVWHWAPDSLASVAAAENAFAFLVGLGSMEILAGVFVWIDKFRADPDRVGKPGGGLQ